ncbi:hypothetical protein RhiirC2_746247, partial [Rhizophagus irregularis]
MHIQNYNKIEIIQQVNKHNIDYIDDEDAIYNNPNLHSEEQDELEIPDVDSKLLYKFFSTIIFYNYYSYFSYPELF